MGCPIASFKKFEYDVKRSGQRLNAVLFSNAESDSKAVDIVCDNYYLWDITSKIRFYLPGYEFGNRRSSLWEQLFYHGNNLDSSEVDLDLHMHEYRRTISSNRGDIQFNIATFSDIVMQFARRIEGFSYSGGTQMVIVPFDYNKDIILYNEAVIYDLNPIAEAQKLDIFINQTFRVLERDSDLQNMLRDINSLYGDIVKRTSVPEAIIFDIDTHLIESMNRKYSWSIKDGEYYFLSYSETDKTYADILRTALERAGINVWMAAYGIPADKPYAAVIPKAIKLAKTFLVLLTPHSIKSENVKSEISIARRNTDKTTTKVVLKDISVSEVLNDDELDYLIGRIQMTHKYDQLIEHHNILREFIEE